MLTMFVWYWRRIRAWLERTGGSSLTYGLL